MSLPYIIDIVCRSFLATSILFLIWSIIRYFRLKKKIKKNNYKDKFNIKKELALWVFVFYIIWLFQITVYRYGINWALVGQRSRSINNLNLIPLVELIAVYKYGTTWAFIYNFIGNIVWFVPLGMILPFIQADMNLKRTVTVGALVSLSIEIMQYVFRTGLCDIDDVIVNVLGTLIGYMMFRVVKHFRRRIKSV